jgi:hypothetical protein
VRTAAPPGLTLSRQLAANDVQQHAADVADVRATVTPKKRADRPRGEWNTFAITMKGDRLWVKLNGEEVIVSARLPDVPREGPLALQHHGGWDAKAARWKGPPSLVQLRNIFIKELR